MCCRLRSDSGQEIVLIVLVIGICEVVLRAAVAAERRAVGELLQIVQAAGDALVAVRVECVEVHGCPADDAGIEFRCVKDQLQRTSSMEYVIESTKTNAGTRKIPMTEDVFWCFQAIIEDREAPRVERMVGGYTGFLFLDNMGMPLVAMHWEHRFNNMVKRYNEIYRVQMPNITPHVCRHTYCSNQARAGMNPKTLQYLMGHSEIGVTMNVYTHLGLEDAAEEMARMEQVESARKEQDKISGESGQGTITQQMFRAV